MKPMRHDIMNMSGINTADATVNFKKFSLKEFPIQ